jgi:ubiquinone/menaquinone biosynthesis C-methylase UbiE
MSNDLLREEFNRWAEAGRGEEMEDHHLPITLPVLDRMHIRAEDNILDVGCGSGWLVRLLAERVPDGRVVGLDVSDEMIRRARQNLADVENVLFVVAGADEIPWDANFFTHAISVESAYYWADPSRGLSQIYRVLAEGGRASILINFYRDNPHCHQWSEHFVMPAHLHSAQEWSDLFRAAGFADVAHDLIPDPTPAPETYSGRWFRDAAQLRAFREIGALLVRGTKPSD